MGKSFNSKRQRYIVQLLLSKYGNKCCICGVKMKLGPMYNNHSLQASIEHVIPKYRGGTNRTENLRLAHRYCNSLKGTIDSPLPALFSRLTWEDDGGYCL